MWYSISASDPLVSYCIVQVSSFITYCFFIYMYFFLKLASCDKKFRSSSGGLSLHSSLSNQECQYDIVGFYGKGIRLTWSSFNVKGKMPDCSDDYVEIFVGCDRHSIGKYCSENSNKPFDVYAQQACLRLKIRSYRSSSFYATYSSFSLLTGNNHFIDESIC